MKSGKFQPEFSICKTVSTVNAETHREFGLVWFSVLFGFALNFKVFLVLICPSHFSTALIFHQHADKIVNCKNLLISRAKRLLSMVSKIDSEILSLG